MIKKKRLAKISELFSAYRTKKKIVEGGRGRIGYPDALKLEIVAGFDEGLTSAELAAAASVSAASVNNFIRRIRPEQSRKRGPPVKTATKNKKGRPSINSALRLTKKAVNSIIGSAVLDQAEFKKFEKNATVIVLKLSGGGGISLLVRNDVLKSLFSSA